MKNLLVEFNQGLKDTALPKATEHITKGIQENVQEAQKELDNMSGHRPNDLWTICVEHHGFTFYLSYIAFEDIARSAAKGIQADNPNARIQVFFAKDQPASAASTAVNPTSNRGGQ